jgi:hypothetical protein
VNLMKLMPEEVFLAPDIDQVNEDIVESVKLKPSSQNPAQKSTKPSTGPKIDHVKGTSVEDILENDYETTAERKEKIDQMFHLRDTGVINAPAPKRRKELVETYMRKPKYSVRRVTLICEWINSLKIWPRKLAILTLHKEICSGLLLSKIFKILKPETVYVNMHEKALVKKAAVQNLEQVLGHIWRSKSLNNSRIPTAEEIYVGNTSKTAILLNELFAVYILRPLYKNAMKVLHWYNHILKQYQRTLPNYIFEEGDLAGVWPHFQSGTALFCVLFHFFGATSIGNGGATQKVDPLQVAGDPSSICDFRSNLIYVFDLFNLIDVDILWTSEDWITNPDTEFIMYQLFLIYEKLKDKQCTLPPAHGDKPGLTSGPNGEALVIGLLFSDAPANMKFLPKTRKAVRLGHDQDSMSLIPIDYRFKNARFSAGGTLPRGMITKNAKIAQINVDFKESKLYIERNNWNARTTVNTEKDNFQGADLERLLREQQKLAYREAAFSNPSAEVSPRRELLLDSPAKDISRSSGKTHDEFTREINALVKGLEDEMTQARQKMHTFEEDLADRYLQLEESAVACSVLEYQTALAELDKERTELELEKKRLQVSFRNR